MQKRCKKLFKTVRAQNTMENPPEYQYFECQLRFLVDFGTPWAPKMGSKIDLGTQLGSGGAQGAPRANFSRFLVNFGVILGPRMVILGPHWDAFWSIRQQTAANRS